MIKVDSMTSVPTCTYIPRQLTQTQLSELLPTKWVTSYETLQSASQPVTSDNPFFVRREDGRVDTHFLPVAVPESHTVFPTEINVIEAAPSKHIWWDGMFVVAMIV